MHALGSRPHLALKELPGKFLMLSLSPGVPWHCWKPRLLQTQRKAGLRSQQQGSQGRQSSHSAESVWHRVSAGKPLCIGVFYVPWQTATAVCALLFVLNTTLCFGLQLINNLYQ